MQGSGFFDSVGDFLKDTFTKPSGILGVASMLPGPLGVPLKVASAITKLTGNGVQGKRNSAKGRGIFKTPQVDSAFYLRPAAGCAGHPVDEALRGMGFGPHHIQQMKGSGVFSSLWNTTRKLGSYLLPIAKKQGLALLKEYGPGLAKRAADMAISRFTGASLLHNVHDASSASQSHYIRFTPAQKRCIVQHMEGDGIFSDVKDKVEQWVRPVIKQLRRRGGNLATLGSVR
jgi:hypothetical protein